MGSTFRIRHVTCEITSLDDMFYKFMNKRERMDMDQLSPSLINLIYGF